MSYRTSEDHAQETSSFRRFVRGMIRRVAVTLTQTAQWQVLGQRGGQGGDETIEVEPFTGIGFYSRPPSSGNPEAIAVAIGGNKAMAVVATRDEATRQKMVGDLGDGETAVYNDLAKLVVKNDGTVAALLPNGIAIPLALQLDLTILRAAISGAAISVGAGGAATIVAACDTAATTACAGLVPPRAPGTPPWPIGTAVLKGQ